jgi:Ni/Co efflux regulator RcnB
MNRFVLASSITLMLLSSAAFAAPRQGGHGDHGHAPDRGHEEDRDHDNDRDDGYWRDHHDVRESDRRYYSDHDNGRHRGFYKHPFRHGERVPVVYLQPRYYVPDYRIYHLAPPPRGYRWIRPPDGRFILVAATTGLIAEILGY